MSITDELRRRIAAFDNVAKSYPVRLAAIRACAAAEELADRKRSIDADDSLSPKGKADALRKAAAERVEQAKIDAKNVGQLIAEMRDARQKLGACDIDKSDFAAAMLRTQVRAWLMEQGPGVAMSHLAAGDQTILEAVAEAPLGMLGLNRAEVETVMMRLAEVRNPAQVREIEQLTEAANVAQAAVTIQLNIMQAAGGAEQQQVSELLAIMRGEDPQG